MKQIYSDVIQFKGSHYAFGRYQAEQLKENPLLTKYRNRRTKSMRKYRVNQKEAKAFFMKYSSGLWAELEGLSAGLGWPLEEVVHEFSGWQQDWIHSGCSIMAKENFFARNYDYHPKTYEGRLVIFQPSEGPALIGPSQRIIGRTDGMNEYGLCVGYNFVNRIKPEDGLICCLLTRILLENCKTTDEAVEWLKELPHRHSFNYVLYDRSRNSRIVEGSPRGIRVRQESVCTNHFEVIPQENRRHVEESHTRLRSLREGHPQLSTGREAFKYLNKTGNPIFSKRYSHWSGTIHTACYYPESLSMLFGLGGDSNPVKFSLGDWMKGNRSPIKQVLGQLDTKEPLPYIDG